jgi:hypothetical protein
MEELVDSEGNPVSYSTRCAINCCNRPMSRYRSIARTWKRWPARRRETAARHWAGGGKWIHGGARGLQMGIPDEVVAARIEANADAVDFDIWPENWDTVEASSSHAVAHRKHWRRFGPGRVYWAGLTMRRPGWTRRACPIRPTSGAGYA